MTDVPAGTYVLVEPESPVSQAVAIGDGVHTVRADDQVWSGQHWLDADGYLHIADTEGPCVGVESVWEYDYTGDTLTMELVEDWCDVRPSPLPDRAVYELR